VMVVVVVSQQFAGGGVDGFMCLYMYLTCSV
jgi:hypothetical protein